MASLCRRFSASSDWASCRKTWAGSLGAASGLEALGGAPTAGSRGRRSALIRASKAGLAGTEPAATGRRSAAAASAAKNFVTAGHVVGCPTRAQDL